MIVIVVFRRSLVHFTSFRSPPVRISLPLKNTISSAEIQVESEPCLLMACLLLGGAKARRASSVAIGMRRLQTKDPRKRRSTRFRTPVVSRPDSFRHAQLPRRLSTRHSKPRHRCGSLPNILDFRRVFALDVLSLEVCEGHLAGGALWPWALHCQVSPWQWR